MLRRLGGDENNKHGTDEDGDINVSPCSSEELSLSSIDVTSRHTVARSTHDFGIKKPVGKIKYTPIWFSFAIVFVHVTHRECALV